MGPQLKANLCGKLRDFETEIISKRSVVEHWFRDMFAKYKPPFYSSVDLRNACFKIAPIDTMKKEGARERVIKIGQQVEGDRKVAEKEAVLTATPRSLARKVRPRKTQKP